MLQWSLIYLLSEWMIRIVMLIYVPQQRSPAAARTWLLLIFLLPWPGIALYALFGRVYLPRHRIEMQARASRRIRAAQERLVEPIEPYEDMPAYLRPIAALATELGDFRARRGNRVELLADYGPALDRLIADIDAAESHVHLLFYILEADATGRRVAEALGRARDRGVECRLLLDAVGSMRGLKVLGPELRHRGVFVCPLLPVGLFRRNTARFDLRNHRKIVVVDGRIGYTGSQNIVDPEFVKDHPNEELMVRVTGPVVRQLQAVFLADYYFETGRVLPIEPLFPDLAPTGPSRAQIVPSGPGYLRENGRELIVTLLYSAQQRIVITTPYFVPDHSVLQAMQSATHRGVAVHLVLPARSNRKVTHLAQSSYYEALLDVGVRIHLYEPRFLHAKHITIDDQLAFIGSANMDIRSFALNCEVNLLVYDPAVVAQLRELQKGYFSQSEILDMEKWRARPLGIKVLQNTARLADTLL